MRGRHHSTWLFITLGLFSLLLLSCDRRTSESDFPENPFTNQFGSDFGNTFDPSIGSADSSFDLGSGSSGGLTTGDETALSNVFGEMNSVNPQDESLDISPELLQQAQALLNQQVNSQNASQIAAQKIALGGQMLKSCLTSVEHYRPKPGEPLLGTWSGGCAGKDFTITGNFRRNFTRRNASVVDTQNPGFRAAIQLNLTGFTASGGVSGAMTVNNVGVGSISGKVKVALSDLERPVAVSVNGKNFTLNAGEGITSKSGCVQKTKQKTWDNQIPQKHSEAMKKLGQCYRKALFLMSPIMDKLFDNMDPKLASLLKQRMLGISK